MKNKKIVIAASILVFSIIALITYDRIFAHCDTLDGPVVKAAKDALESGNVNLVLIWVQKEDEKEIREMFDKILAVRKQNPETKELADMYFFETLVRIHRAGEGEPYTGLKPAGTDQGPVIPAGDKAIEEENVKGLQKIVLEAVEHGIEERFKEVVEKKNYDKNNVEAGREFVKAYVEFLHYAEKIYGTAVSKSEGHENHKTHGGHTE